MSKHEKKHKSEKKEKRDKKHEKHEKKRKNKKVDRKEESSKKFKSKSSEEIERKMNLKVAMEHIHSLSREFPTLSSDLKIIMEMLDKGESVVIGGIENKDIKRQLAILFPLMGLVEDGPNESYSKHKIVKRIVYLEEFKAAFETPVSASTIINNTPEERKIPTRNTPIGPQMPPPFNATSHEQCQEEDDDFEVGPALPGMKGFREASVEVEERIRKQAEEVEAQKWEQIRRGGNTTENNGPVKLQREEWMLSLPKDDSIQAALGGLGDQGPRKFRGRDKDERDDSWFAAPEDRERALREKAQLEMLGYVPGKQTASIPVQAAPSNAYHEAASVPIQRRKEKSLFEVHQETMKKQNEENPSPAAWDRERDMAGKRQLTGAAATQLIQQANEMSSRFAAPKVTRQFL